MATLYKLAEWQGSSGIWYCEHTGTFPDGVQKWVIPARLMEMSVDNFLEWLIEKFQPDYFNHNKDCSFCSWGWLDQQKMRKYKNTINKIAREKNFKI